MKLNRWLFFFIRVLVYLLIGCILAFIFPDRAENLGKLTFMFCAFDFLKLFLKKGGDKIKEEKQPDKWKTIAIIFISLFIFETVLGIALVSYSLGQIKREDNCIDWCLSKEECEYYLYDYVTNTCEIYGIEDKLINKKTY